jgi:hypothetical protein
MAVAFILEALALGVAAVLFRSPMVWWPVASCVLVALLSLFVAGHAVK